ncbi:MAG: Eco57I restriction-modification methylase domain-containing protein [Saprospiraceae bacterium]
MNKLNVRKALNKAFLKVKPNRQAIDGFKNALNHLLQRINPAESEEFNKNLLSDFFKEFAFQPDYFINTNGRTDLVIHQGKNAKTPISVMIEAKKPNKKAEMPTTENLNAKATQELLLYYLRERITNNNLAIKHLIITDTLQWFVFDAAEFEKYFGSDKKLVKQFQDFKNEKLSGTKTDFFYNNIAKAAIDKVQNEITFTHFDLNDYQKIAAANDVEKSKKLIPLFKILSPEHLLKLKFANDSNTLDKRFYAELLHLIGLHEVGKSKKTIERLPKGKRNNGSLLENTIVQLESTNRLRKLANRKQYGKTETEQLEAVALELVITWVNRILFLKLLEAQLLTYHKGDKSYSFLHYDKLNEYDEVSALFFQVLAKQPKDRTDFNHQNFEKVPYLNSSLFEPTELEEDTIFINALRDKFDLPLLTTTVLKDDNGKRLTGKRNTLEYLFAFLDAYDFASEGTEDIQEEQKTIINASVLGLIFEKINGYKDGSFFTPGFITMYMCRETLRRAVIQKFNEAKDWNCQTFEDLKEDLNIDIRKNKNGRNAARLALNTIFNQIKICDPAVGSGHFLVSALNELIAIKSELGILADEKGDLILDYLFTVENDELVVTKDEDNTLFQYNPTSTESSRIQKTLFHEKQTIIENCLFGVDINPNSVKICRLRLWIELLKNAYYKKENELETLPNIDINIQCGNSLISRFDLDTDLKEVLKEAKKQHGITLKKYKNAFQRYRQTNDKAVKYEMAELIQKVKTTFRTSITKNSKDNKKLVKLSEELYYKYNATSLFETKLTKAQQKDKTALTKNVDKLKAKIQEEENNVIYENAFEWRFEFPEVLNDDGEFLGFDVVIGNPPYVSANDLKKSVSKEEYNFYKSNFRTAKGTVDVYIYFFELGFNLLKKPKSFISFITPNRFLSASYGKALRNIILNEMSLLLIGDYSNVKVFKEASTYPIVTILSNETKKHNLKSYTYKEDSTITYREYNSKDLYLLNDSILGFVLSNKFIITKKVINQSVPLTHCGKINATSTASEAAKFHEYINEKDGFKLINTGTIDKFCTTWGINKMTDKGKKYLTPYLSKNKEILKNRFGLYSKPKIIFAKIAKTPEAFFDIDGKFASVNTNCIHSFNNMYSPFYIVAWVNSTLFQYIFECFFDGLKMSGGYLLYSSPNISNMYIKDISQNKQEPFKNLVTEILTIKQENPEADTIDLEREIDKLVYALYDLTAEEIAIVEKG